MQLLIKGGRVIDPANNIDGLYDVLVEDGKVVEVSSHVSHLTSHADIIDASGKIVVPGLIDIHVHLREPGYEWKETVKTGTAAAVAGGFTSVACMANTEPVNDDPSITEYILRKAKIEGSCNVFPIGAISKGLKGEELANIGELKEAGCVAVSDDGRPVMNADLMRRALEYASSFGLTVISHAEDLTLAKGGAMNEGAVATRLGLRGIPNAAEDVMVARDIALAELTGARLHIAHISTKAAVRIIRNAKARGVKVTAETAPHYFTLTEEAVEGYNTNAKMNPPLGTAEDVAAIKEGLTDGTIDCIATDHAPHDPDSKDVEFPLAANGIVGLETSLPLTLNLVKEGVLTLSQAIEKLTVNPARAIGLKKGTLSVGADADITIIDLNEEWAVEPAKLKSKSKNTPFAGLKMKGKAVATIVGGKR
ncbi:MAG: dihydroorotase [Deltaproteobacteria bacterium]|nr:dihydroorotase [Deltaproteobacteria bacterium]